MDSLVESYSYLRGVVGVEGDLEAEANAAVTNEFVCSCGATALASVVGGLLDWTGGDEGCGHRDGTKVHVNLILCGRRERFVDALTVENVYGVPGSGDDVWPGGDGA